LCGVDLIKSFEGCHLNAYPDPLTGGLPITIGWGSTKDFDGTPFKIGKVITQKYADTLLEFDLKNRYLPSLQRIPYWNPMHYISIVILEPEWKQDCQEEELRKEICGLKNNFLPLLQGLLIKRMTSGGCLFG